MNYNTDIEIANGVKEHYDETMQFFAPNKVVGVFLAGSQNYGLNDSKSDIDTKAIILPSMDSIIFNQSPISTTHIRDNDEHIDFKDIRLMMQMFRKQNINYLEILFTNHFYLNPLYAHDINTLRYYAETVAHYDRKKAVCTMYGTMKTKREQMSKDTPAKHEVYMQLGYDPKELLHLLRVGEFIERYINGETYRECLRPASLEYLKSVKRGIYTLKDAERCADVALNKAKTLVDDFLASCSPTTEDEYNHNAGNLLLDSVQRNIMEQYMKEELS